MPEVSVIITSYNHEKYLHRRIESVLSQTYQDYEVLIYDDCSDDGSKTIIEKYRHHPKVGQIVYNDKNSGSPFKQWEKSIPQAAGKWIWIAQSDDYADPEFLACLVKLTKENDNIGIAFCGSYWIDDNDAKGADLSLYDQSFFRAGPEEIRKKLAKQCSVQNASSAIIRRDLAIEAIKGIGAYKACGDWIFYLRMLQHSNIVYTGIKLNYFRWYHSNISNSAKDDGTWIYEGIDVLKNIDYRKIAFTLTEFYSVVKWWLAIIHHSGIKDKFKMDKVVLGALHTWFAHKIRRK